MLSPQLRHKVKNLWDLFWSSGLSNPLVAIEQITFLLFIRQLESLDRERVKMDKISIYTRTSGEQKQLKALQKQAQELSKRLAQPMPKDPRQKVVRDLGDLQQNQDRRDRGRDPHRRRRPRGVRCVPARQGAGVNAVHLTTGRTRTSGYPYPMAIETRNVIGSVLKPCSLDPLTGWHRDGCCRTGAGDQGVHVVCARVNDKFLQFSKNRGNDLTTPRPEFGFPGLTAGDQWCLCAARWQEAFEAGCAPEVVLEATHESALEFIDLESLKAHAC